MSEKPGHNAQDPGLGRLGGREAVERVVQPELGSLLPSFGVVSDEVPGKGEGFNDFDVLTAVGQVLRRNLGVVVGSVVAGVALAVVVALGKEPIYEAKTTIEIQGVNEKLLNMSEIDPARRNYLSDGYIHGQAEILQNETLIERVIRKLDLDKNEEEDHPSILSTVISAIRGDGDEEVEPRDDAAKMEGLVQFFRNSLAIEPDPRARLVTILLHSTDPELAATFVNTMVSEYMAMNLEAHWQSTKHTRDWLAGRLADLKQKLEDGAGKLQRHALTAGLVFSAETGGSVAEEKLLRLQRELADALADRLIKEARMSRGSYGERSEDVFLGRIQGNLTALRQELAALSVTYAPTSSKIKPLKAEISALETSLVNGRERFRGRVEEEYEIARVREEMLRKACVQQTRLVSEQKAKAIEYDILKRELNTDRELYDKILQRFNDAAIASAGQPNNVRVLGPARPPMLPGEPSVPQHAIFGVVTGALFGVVFALIRERADRSVRTPVDASSRTSLRQLGIVPSAVIDRDEEDGFAPNLMSAGKSILAGESVMVRIGKTTGHSPNSMELVAFEKSDSLLAESFRAIVASLTIDRPRSRTPATIVVTSPGPSEGKTTVATNLAITLAQTGRRVLLIDGDLHRPRIHKVFSADNSVGLSDLIGEQVPIDNSFVRRITQNTKVPGLRVIAAGPAPDNVHGLLYSSSLPTLLEMCRETFDKVVIDTPPVMYLADARVISRFVDGVILVIRSRQTSIDESMKAVQQLREDGAPLLGMIFNDWDPTGYGQYYRQYSHYYNYQKSS